MSTATLYSIAHLQNDALSLAKSINTALRGDKSHANTNT